MYTTIWEAPLAFFGGHKTGPDLYSLMSPTYSTTVGLLRSIMGHRGTSWVPHEVALLRFGGRYPLTMLEMKRFPTASFDAGSNQTIRTWVVLYNITLRIKASLHADAKYLAMFERRIQNGQFFRPLRFGPKEYVCTARMASPQELVTPTLDITEDMGIQPFAQDFDDPQQPWYYAPMTMNKGVVRYPTFKEVQAFGLKRIVKEVPQC